MAIHNEQAKSMQGGFNKGIEGSAMQLILDNLQKYQYQYPIKSTVREIISNALDSVSEREVARKILKGTHKVEDFFEQREGEIYQDSKFDPSYYDLKWLSSDARVHMTYMEGNALEKDRVEFRDNGVGLGEYRLIKYFSLGYSTKRLSKLPLGKFGIGGKAPLSTGVDFFTMESRYNGKKFRFNVYDHTVDSIIPGSEHYILIDPGTPQEYKVYFEPTTELNGVTITLGVKKAHKLQYIDAVKSQLLYFNNIDFNILHDDGRLEKVDYQTEILYEDDDIVLSDNQYWNKPHLLLNKVNYGYIAFEELELENKVGNIGIKIAPEEVDVNPSRESVVWTEKTKATVQAKFEGVVSIATKLLQEELRENDYLKWLRTCYSISNRFFAGDNVTSRLAKIVDLTQIKPAFLPNPSLKFSNSSNLGGLFIRSVGLSKEIIANRQKTRVVRKELKTVQTAIDKTIILMGKEERASNRKDKWLLSPQFQNSLGGGRLTSNDRLDLFVTIQEPMTEEEMQLAGISEEFIQDLKIHMNKRVGAKDKEVNNRYETWDALMASSEILKYSDIVVPEDFKSTDDEIVEEEVKEELKQERREEEKVAVISAKERRAAEGKILIYTPRGTESLIDYYDPKDPYKAADYGKVPNPAYDINQKTTYDALNTQGKIQGANDQFIWVPSSGTVLGQKAYDWQKIEIEIKEMNDWAEEEIYYSDGDDELMNFVAMLSRDPNPNNTPGNARRGTGFDLQKSYSLTNWQEKKWYRLNQDYLKKHKVAPRDAIRCQHFYDNREIKLIKTAKGNFKYIKDFRSVDRFFLTITNNTITMSNLLIRWNTARLIKGKLDKAKFLSNFSSFNQRYHELYKELERYQQQNWREINWTNTGNVFGLDKQTCEDMIKHLDKVQEFQEYVASRPTPEEVKSMAEYLFGNDQLKDGMAVDPDIMHKLHLVQEYANGCGTLLNYIPQLCIYNAGQIPGDLEMEIKQYLDFKGMLNFKTEEELLLDDVKGMSPTLEEFVEGEVEGQRAAAISDFQAGLTNHEDTLLKEEFINAF